MKLRVLVSLEADPVTSPGGSRQKSRRCTTVKIVNNVVIARAEFTRNPRPTHQPPAFEHHYVVDVWVMIEYRRHPVFNENVDLNPRKKTLESHY